MSILGVIVRARADLRTSVQAQLLGLPGVDLAADPGDGRFVIVIEDCTDRSAAATLGDIATWPAVINTSLVYEYSGPDSPAPGAEVSSYTDWRNGLADLTKNKAA